jgi:hypothetical protein
LEAYVNAILNAVNIPDFQGLIQQALKLKLQMCTQDLWDLCEDIIFSLIL